MYTEKNNEVLGNWKGGTAHGKILFGHTPFCATASILTTYCPSKPA